MCGRRLAFGTDQGRWLQQQVGDGPKRRARATSAHVFHEIDGDCGGAIPMTKPSEEKDSTAPDSTMTTAIVAGCCIGALLLLTYIVAKLS